MRQLGAKKFYRPQDAVREEKAHASSCGELLIVSCRSGAYLAAKVAARYQGLLAELRSHYEVPHLEAVDFQFSDTETCVRLKRHVAGCDVFLFQAMLDPTSGRSVDENYMALLLTADTLRQWGAQHVTAVLPYLAYARQDKPSKHQREPTTARFMADLTLRAGIDRLVTWHPHTPQLPGFYAGIRVDSIDARYLFAEAFHRFRGREDVIVVAPDVGASKFVTSVAQALELPSAIAIKLRPRPEEAVTTEIIGDLAGKKVAIVLDDMMATGGTVDALIRRLIAATDIEEVYLGASHNLCLDKAYERLLALHASGPLKEVLVTNSIPQAQAFQSLPWMRVTCLSDTLARVINRIHLQQSVSELFAETTPTDASTQGQRAP